MNFDELEKLAKAATPGPWEAFFMFGSDDLPAEILAGDGTSVCTVDENAVNPTPNFRFIAAANPQTVLELIASLRSARAENARLREALKRIAAAPDVEATQGLFESRKVARAALEGK